MRDVTNAMRYYGMVIASFADRDTEALAGGRKVRRYVAIEKVARRKLRQLEIAGNRLEALKGR